MSGINHTTTRTPLIRKYDVALPRYTSYPTVPHWDKGLPDDQLWRSEVRKAWISGGKSLSLYIHLLFCESLCTYCACNTRITTNHSVEKPYIDRIIAEWKMYSSIIGETPAISELHLGGGTPTFFSSENLKVMMDAILSDSRLEENAALSFEAHPASTTIEHLQILYNSGFRRLSLGVQDFDSRVQKAIHRLQTAEQVESTTLLARKIGYSSVNFDLIYGLPFQSLETITATINQVVKIKPDRIAFYSCAHVPWMKPGQRGYEDADLPSGEVKRSLYEKGREILEAAGYVEIGLDHFALPGDELLTSAQNGNLHRNFMGYTVKHNPLLIGIGPSSISDAATMFVQNHKTLEDWNAAIDKGQLPLIRGHALTAEDLILRKHILNIMCRNYTDWTEDIGASPFLTSVHDRLSPLEADGLIETTAHTLKVTVAGQTFLRNIGACFDARLHDTIIDKPMFSKSV